MTQTSLSILLTGASGYVGGRLLKKLEQEDFTLRCLARFPEFLQKEVLPETKVVKGDALDFTSLVHAMEGIDIAVYLIHSMGAADKFEEQDKLAALNFSRAAKQQGVKKIIYLGGLSQNPSASAHMRSRTEVGQILRSSGVPTLEFKASIIIGSGSLSFELLRSLADKLPVMIMPRWVNVLAQPIGIEDLLTYLEEGIKLPMTSNQVVEIGGGTQLTYRELIAEYAKQKKLNRILLPVPVLTPWLSSLWLGLVTPVYARIGRKLIDSIKYPSIVANDSAQKLFSIKPAAAETAIQAALLEEETASSVSNWDSSISSAGLSKPFLQKDKKKHELKYRTAISIPCTPEQAFKPIASIGGRNGWYAYNLLWQIRGIIDLLLGGVGLRKTRNHRSELKEGTILDFWRIEKYEPPYWLTLLAEMKLPGKANLEWLCRQEGDDTKLIQTATFQPNGFWGYAYWYMLYPAHVLIFTKMIKGIANRVDKGSQ